MSLNRTEQFVFDYLQRNPEEKHHWTQKVRVVAGGAANEHAAAATLDAELWHYFRERCAVAEPFRQFSQAGMQRTSFRNLAEHLIRLWTPPKAKRPTQDLNLT